MKKTEATLLNAYSIQRNCARVVLYAPLSYGGLGIQHLYHVQGIQKLKFFNMHIRRNDNTGKLLQISMKWTQLEIGTKQSFFQESYYDMNKYITKTWLTHIWEYLHSCQITMQIMDDITRGNKRINDFYLMDVVKNLKIPDRQKIIFNQVRMQLQIETASDIVTLGKGSEIREDIINGQKGRVSTLM